MNETPQKGTSLDYCLECAEKHLQTATILLKEALQRYEECHKKDPCTPCCISQEPVLEKIRDAIAELTGAEDDTNPLANEPLVKDINTQIRQIRKEIWNKKLAFGQGTPQDITQIANKIKQLTEYIYQNYTKNTYKTEIEQIIKEEKQQIDTAIQQALKAQQQEKQQKTTKPKTNTKKLIKELSKPTQQEIEEALYKNMIKQYAKIYTPPSGNE